MNLNKHLEFFNPVDINDQVHVIGIGAMGSRVVELLVRLGVENIHLYDFDTVDEYNITNQYYTREHIGKPKTEALLEMMVHINPNAIAKIHSEGYKAQSLSGYVFLCVDSIELRYKIAKENEFNLNIKAMFDTRMRLEDAQSYAADWKDKDQKKMFINSMKFTDAEAQEATPVSACGTTLSVAPTVVTTASLTVSNLINFIKGKELQSIILVDAFNYTLVTY